MRRTDAKNATPPPEEPLALEAILAKLTGVVDALEHGDLPLEESLRMFEDGVRLARLGQQRLDAAEKRVERLVAGDGDDAVLEPVTGGAE